MSTPALIALATACLILESVWATLCSKIKSSQSETVKPANPHLFFKTSVIKYLFLCPGIPFTSPLLIITVKAPCLIASSNGGR